MNLGEIKRLLYEAVLRYHPKAAIVWEKTKGVTPRPPYITLGYHNLNRALFTLSDDDGIHRYYNYSLTFEVNLYTDGRELTEDGEGIGAYENTAVEDLEEFVRFLDSEEMTDELARHGVTILVEPPIRDLSELIGDIRFQYRAMAEFTVSFMGASDGRYGISGNKVVPNPSGGGTIEMAEAVDEFIEEAEINEEEGKRASVFRMPSDDLAGDA